MGANKTRVSIVRALSLSLILLACNNPSSPQQASLIPPKLYHTFTPYLRDIRINGQLAFYAMTAGIVTNRTGLMVRDVKPELKLYFSRQDFDDDRPAITTFGAMGYVKDPYEVDLGLREIRADIGDGQTLDHWTRTENFLIPQNYTGIWYRFSFGQPYAVRPSGVFHPDGRHEVFQ